MTEEREPEEPVKNDPVPEPVRTEPLPGEDDGSTVEKTDEDPGT